MVENMRSLPFTSIVTSNVDAPTAYNGQIPCSPIDWYRVFEALLAEARDVSIEATLPGPIWSHLGEHPDPSQVPRHGSDNCMFRRGCATSRCRTVPLPGLWIEMGIEPILFWHDLGESIVFFSLGREAVFRITMFSKLPSNHYVSDTIFLERCSYVYSLSDRSLGSCVWAQYYVPWFGTLCADSTHFSAFSIFLAWKSVFGIGKSAISALSYGNESRRVAGGDSRRSSTMRVSGCELHANSG
ncbi:hypothetical protein NXS19_010238 [Fusarium pseudograminearum]|nr:hypothetical protein NXS19_010238 [Fusarium pseudograminearum]